MYTLNIIDNEIWNAKNETLHTIYGIIVLIFCHYEKRV